MQRLCLFTASAVSRQSGRCDPGARITVDGNQPRGGQRSASKIPRTKDSVSVGSRRCGLGMVRCQGEVISALEFGALVSKLGLWRYLYTIVWLPISQQERARCPRHTAGKWRAGVHLFQRQATKQEYSCQRDNDKTFRISVRGNTKHPTYGLWSAAVS